MYGIDNVLASLCVGRRCQHRPSFLWNLPTGDLYLAQARAMAIWHLWQTIILGGGIILWLGCVRPGRDQLASDRIFICVRQGLRSAGGRKCLFYMEILDT
jgi:hypothetical protein